MAAGQIESILLPVVILIVAFCSAVIVKRWIRKKPIGAASQYMGQNIYMQYQNAEKRHSIEQVMFQKEDERQEAFGGESSEFDLINEEE